MDGVGVSGFPPAPVAVSVETFPAVSSVTAAITGTEPCSGATPVRDPVLPSDDALIVAHPAGM
jgi:hypothetical protein